jgi:hypothetical protein
MQRLRGATFDRGLSVLWQRKFLYAQYLREVESYSVKGARGDVMLLESCRRSHLSAKTDLEILAKGSRGQSGTNT